MDDDIIVHQYHPERAFYYCALCDGLKGPIFTNLKKIRTHLRDVHTHCVAEELVSCLDGLDELEKNSTRDKQYFARRGIYTINARGDVNHVQWEMIFPVKVHFKSINFTISASGDGPITTVYGISRGNGIWWQDPNQYTVCRCEALPGRWHYHCCQLFESKHPLVPCIGGFQTVGYMLDKGREMYVRQWVEAREHVSNPKKDKSPYWAEPMYVNLCLVTDTRGRSYITWAGTNHEYTRMAGDGVWYTADKEHCIKILCRAM